MSWKVVVHFALMPHVLTRHALIQDPVWHISDSLHSELSRHWGSAWTRKTVIAKKSSHSLKEKFQSVFTIFTVSSIIDNSAFWTTAWHRFHWKLVDDFTCLEPWARLVDSAWILAAWVDASEVMPTLLIHSTFWFRLCNNSYKSRKMIKIKKLHWPT